MTTIATVPQTIEQTDEGIGAFAQSETLFRNGDIGRWVEVSQEMADYCLNVLPPIYVAGGFMVSEPYTHTAEGAVYTGIATVGTRHFMQTATRSQFAANIRVLGEAL